MCSVTVLKMAEDAGPPGQDQTPRQPVHPFFTPNRLLPSTGSAPGHKDAKPTDDISLPHSGPADGKSGDDVLEKSSGRQVKRRKVNPENGGEVVKRKRGRPRKFPANNVTASPQISNQNVDVGRGVGGDDGATSDTFKVLESSEPKITNLESELQPKFKDTVVLPAIEAQSKPDQTSQAPFQPPSTVLNNDAPPKPKKMLLFNPKTGTIGSPPKSKMPKTVGAKAHDVNGSPEEDNSPSRIVRMVYGTDPESRGRIGKRINGVLSGNHRVPSAGSETQAGVPSPSSPEIAEAKGPNSTKTTHPFFLGKSKQSDVPAEEIKQEKVEQSPAPKRARHFTSTPCSPKKPRTETPITRLAQFGTKNPVLKFPGAKLPAWPWKGMVHVRGNDDILQLVEKLSPVLTSRKSKGHSVKVTPFESVMDFITRELQIPLLLEATRNVNTDEFLPPPLELRLPEKHFESGVKLQARIIPELRSFKSLAHGKKSRRPEQAGNGMGNGLNPPPQLARLFDSVRSGLSAFDLSQCETANWTQKYAPSGAVEVLQPGREAYLLRDWLQALMVQSVDTGSTEAERSKLGSSKTKTASAGKKKRRKKMDGFIVSSGDEDYELAELTETEEDWAANGTKGVVRKTVVRSGDLSKLKGGVKVANTLVISGPHGCGKTAAVYAVAQELGFEVFEINPGSRRGGKDILDKIGDMTRNHLVQQHKSTNRSEEGEAVVTDDELAKDLKSGKQATMNAFFKPKSVPSKPKDVPKRPVPVQAKEAKKEPPKSQRQSLILLEEVDILYGEDKQFWATVVELVTQSKRPFIMTCNDETLVPLQTLRLHGIFRFSPPPRELAIDRLLLLAANEGHALTRRAVETLYESRGQDLRAATMDLQYWCQIGVGDRRGGFDWFYPRWPKGVDLDEDKNVIRVVSQGTYHAGMSWLGRDTIVDPKASPRMIEEEILHQTWESWGLDMGHWQDTLGLPSWAASMASSASDTKGRLDALEVFDDLSEALSVADVCSCQSFAPFKEELLDTTLPDIPPKAQEDFILGLPPLDSPLVLRYDSLITWLPSTLKSLARSILQARTKTLQSHAAQQLAPLNESKVVEYIENSFQTWLPGSAQISRLDFAFAFDPISESDSNPLQPVSYLDPSVFDRNLELIALEVAPYVRGIVAYDSRLQKQRLKLSSLVSQGGTKRMRTTRAALSALEGGSRSTTRGEKWFKADINPYFVMKTAGKGWDGDEEEVEEEVVEKHVSESSSESSPQRSVKKAKGTGGRRGRKKAIVEDDSGDELGAEADVSTCLD